MVEHVLNQTLLCKQLNRQEDGRCPRSLTRFIIIVTSLTCIFISSTCIVAHSIAEEYHHMMVYEPKNRRIIEVANPTCMHT